MDLMFFMQIKSTQNKKYVVNRKHSLNEGHPAYEYFKTKM